MAPRETPAAFDELDEADAARLEQLMGEAMARQRAALERAIEGGLRHIPRLLRAPVKKALFR